MSLRIFNTLTRTVEPFVPLDPEGKRVGFYCCGPTVHDFAHIGNFRTFVFADLIRRHLDAKGYQVRHVMNVTDVEDKIISRVRAQNVPLREYTGRYEAAFLKDLDRLGCVRPHEMPHATDFIPAIIELIGRLMTRGLAYQASDGSIYFSIERYRAAGHCYGQLVHLNFDEMRPGERVSNDEYGKEALADFALWKARVDEDGPVYWESPWGQGRPGWHIECSAMSMQILGPSFDLHVGGEDLAFPHHEDEIAQSEGACLQPAGHRFVKYWMHGAHLLVEGRKMSKSLGNFYTLADLVNQGFAGAEIRFLLLSAHYRESFNFTIDGLHGARKALGRLIECRDRLTELAGGADGVADAEVLGRFIEALDDDLNVSAAWAVIFDWVREQNRLLAANQHQSGSAADALATWRQFDRIFGITAGEFQPAGAAGDVPPAMVALLEERQAARKAKDFKRADAIRDELKAAGWVIEDTPKGPRLKHA